MILRKGRKRIYLRNNKSESNKASVTQQEAYLQDNVLTMKPVYKPGQLPPEIDPVKKWVDKPVDFPEIPSSGAEVSEKKGQIFFGDDPNWYHNSSEAENQWQKMSADDVQYQIQVHLSWQSQVKVGLLGGRVFVRPDLGCMYRLKDGKKGMIWSLVGHYGSEITSPYMRLDEEEVLSSSAAEKLILSKPDTIEFAIVFAHIGKEVPYWQAAQATARIMMADRQDIIVELNGRQTKERFCAIASMKNVNGKLRMKREEVYFNDRQTMDRVYQFWLPWVHDDYEF